MALSAPKKWTFWLGVILWVIGLIGIFMKAQWAAIGPADLSVWLGMIGGLVIVLGNLLKDL